MTPRGLEWANSAAGPFGRARQAAARGVLRLSSTAVGRALAPRVAVLDAVFQNDSTNGALNGEKWLLERLAPLHPATVFDVGANRGEWTAMARAALPGSVVHAFEPLPAPFGDLCDRFRGDQRVLPVQVALSAIEGDAEMWVHEHDTAASLIAVVPGRITEGPFPVRTTTGAAYCAEHAIEAIDLLKIDVEGHEMEVLEGLAPLLAAGTVAAVQFEFTAWAVLARRWLRDYVDLFDGYGMVVGKLYPRRVDFSPYRVEHERFLRCNFVAVAPDSPQQHALTRPPGRR